MTKNNLKPGMREPKGSEVEYAIIESTDDGKRIHFVRSLQEANELISANLALDCRVVSTDYTVLEVSNKFKVGVQLIPEKSINERECTVTVLSTYEDTALP